MRGCFLALFLCSTSWGVQLPASACKAMLFQWASLDSPSASSSDAETLRVFEAHRLGILPTPLSLSARGHIQTFNGWTIQAGESRSRPLIAYLEWLSNSGASAVYSSEYLQFVDQTLEGAQTTAIFAPRTRRVILPLSFGNEPRPTLSMWHESLHAATSAAQRARRFHALAGEIHYIGQANEAGWRPYEEFCGLDEVAAYSLELFLLGKMMEQVPDLIERPDAHREIENDIAALERLLGQLIGAVDNIRSVLLADLYAQSPQGIQVRFDENYEYVHPLWENASDRAGGEVAEALAGVLEGLLLVESDLRALATVPRTSRFAGRYAELLQQTWTRWEHLYALPAFFSR